MQNYWSQDLFYKAFNFAANAHNGQKVPGSELPYITHIAYVCAELMAAIDGSMDGNLIIQCGALHDTLEDTSTSLDTLLFSFGKEVADGVSALSKNYELEKSVQLEDSIKRILLQPKEVWMVKMADRITNLNKPPKFWSREKKENYLRQSQLLYSSLQASNAILADRLKNKIEQYIYYM